MVVAIKFEFSELPPRKRGRPKGKNRVPLTQEEKKARNAHYERQRRGACSNALNHLATVLGCPDSMSRDDVIKSASRYIKKFSNPNKRESLDFLRRVDGLLNYQIEKLCPQLGINVDEIDDLEIGIVEANTNEIHEDLLIRANTIPEVITPNANVHERDENVKDESAHLRTHNKKRGTKRRKLDASHNQAWSSQESTSSQSGVLSTSTRPTVSNINYSDTTEWSSSSSHEWRSSLDLLTSYPSTSSCEGSFYSSGDGSSSSSSVEYQTVPVGTRDSTSSFKCMNSNATSLRFPLMPTSPTPSNKSMTSYQGSQNAVSPGISSSPSSTSPPAESLAVHYSELYSNVSIDQPRIWALQSVEPFTFETPSSESSTFETLSPEAVLPAVYPYEDISHETGNAISFDTLMHESPSPEATVSYDTSSYNTASYETASAETASRDAAALEITIPESIMPQLLAYFPVWPTPESITSTSPTNPELQWSSTQIQPVPQLQLQSQSLQPVVQPWTQPKWLGQQPYNCESQINFNFATTSSQSTFLDLEEQSAPMEFPWPKLSHETDQMATDFYRQN